MTRGISAGGVACFLMECPVLIKVHAFLAFGWIQTSEKLSFLANRTRRELAPVPLAVMGGVTGRGAMPARGDVTRAV